MIMVMCGESTEVRTSTDGLGITGSISVEKQCRSQSDLPEFGLSTGATIFTTGRVLTVTKTLPVQG